MRAKATIAADGTDAALADLGFALHDNDPDNSRPFPGFAPADWNSDPETLIPEILAIHNVAAGLAERVLEAIRNIPDRAAGDPLADLAAGLAACLSFAPFATLGSGGSVALVGPPGAGKTTLAAKLAARAKRGHPLLLNTDTGGSGAQAQLAEYAGVLGADLKSADDIEAVARTMRGGARRIIIDTSGVNPFDGGAMQLLAGIVNAARAEPVLVLPANIEREEAVAFVGAFRVLPIRRLVVTRLDIVRRLGGMLAAIEAGGYDLVGGSVTPHFAYGLRPLTAAVLARRLMSAALDGRRWRTS
jgi:flagellar biosynthesis protein FlhF